MKLQCYGLKTHHVHLGFKTVFPEITLRDSQGREEEWELGKEIEREQIVEERERGKVDTTSFGDKSVPLKKRA